MGHIAKDWYEVIPVSDGVSLIRELHVAPWLRCNMWHIRGRDHDILIDTGMGVRPLKKEVALLAERPVTAVQSHSHFDHSGGSHEFDTRLGHKCEAHLMTDPHADDEGSTDPYWPFVRAETFSALPHDGFDWRQYDVRPAPLTGHLDEGDVVDLGNRHFNVLHVPGHSPGSIALWEEETGILFSGDLLYNGDLLDTVYHSNREVYRESLARIREFPVTAVHGGHYSSFDRTRMRQLIDNYFAGGQRIEDMETWVLSKIAETA
jgi:glyoxylase-like metal-dependent hydrolase (beta-lactamase superfamily II)